MEQFQLTGTASLAEELDKALMVVLRDNRKIVGTLRSFDQFGDRASPDVCDDREA